MFDRKKVINFFQLDLRFAPLRTIFISCDHLCLGHPLFLLPVLGSQTVVARAQFSWSILATCPPHQHLRRCAVVASSSKSIPSSQLLVSDLVSYSDVHYFSLHLTLAYLDQNDLVFWECPCLAAINHCCMTQDCRNSKLVLGLMAFT